MKLRLNKTVAAVASGALLLMAVPAVGIASSAVATVKPTYTIGYEGPLTGGAAQIGIPMKYAVQLAINEANKSGKLPFKLAFKAFDDQGDPTISPTQAQAAVAIKNLVAIVGPAFSGATAAAEPYYSAAKIATVSPSATNPTLATQGWKNFFRVVADDGVQGPADATYLVKKLGLKSVYVTNDGTTYGAGLAQAVATQAQKDGATVTTATVPGTGQCNNGTGSVSEYGAAATQVVASGAKALFYGGYYCDLGLFLGALNQAGYTGTVMSGDGADNPGIVSSTTPASAAEGVLLSCACAQSTNKKFNAAYTKLSHIPAATAEYAPESYDATNTIIAALKKLKKITRANLVTQLHKTVFKGITKTIRFQKDGNIAGSAIYVSVVKNGKIVQKGLE